MLQSIDRFGVKAVFGRDVLSYGEIARMRYVENLGLIYKQREHSQNWPTWAKDNPAQAEMLNEAEQLFYGRQ